MPPYVAAFIMAAVHILLAGENAHTLGDRLDQKRLTEGDDSSGEAVSTYCRSYWLMAHVITH